MEEVLLFCTLCNGFDCKIKRRIVDPMGRYIGIKAESRMKTIFCLMFTHLTLIVNPQGLMNILLMFFKYTKIKSGVPLTAL